MNARLSVVNCLTLVGIPLIAMALVIYIVKSAMFQLNPRAVSVAVTLDLLLTIPLISFLLIRRTAAPKILVIAFFFVGIIVASVILPPENQQLLSFIKTWVFPVIEICVIAFLVIKVRAALNEYNQTKESAGDFFVAVKNICRKLFPKSIAVFFASEVAVVYYGLIRWKRNKPTTETEFTYHKNSGTMAILVTFMLLVIAETAIMHLLLIKWSVIAAWVLTGLSIYTAIQLLGFLKSIAHRPIIVTGNKVYLRYGILSETIIDIADIESIILTNQSTGFNEHPKSLSLFVKFEGHNVVMQLKRERVLEGIYGIDRKFTAVALWIDNKNDFQKRIQALMATAI